MSYIPNELDFLLSRFHPSSLDSTLSMPKKPVESNYLGNAKEIVYVPSKVDFN